MMLMLPITLVSLLVILEQNYSVFPFFFLLVYAEGMVILYQEKLKKERRKESDGLYIGYGLVMTYE